jgi:hypothetical protein
MLERVKAWKGLCDEGSERDVKIPPKIRERNREIIF